MIPYKIKYASHLKLSDWQDAGQFSGSSRFWFMPEIYSYFKKYYDFETHIISVKIDDDDSSLPISVSRFKKFGISYKGAYIHFAPTCSSGEGEEINQLHSIFDQAFSELGLDYIVSATSPLASGPHKPPLPCMVTPWQTAVIDLTQPEELLWKNLERHAKKNIDRLKSQSNLAVRVLSDADSIEAFYVPLLRASRSERGAAMPRLYPCRNLCESICKNPAFVVKAFVTFLDQEPVAAIGLVGTQEGVMEVGVAHSSKDKQLKLYSHDLLKWEIIRQSKAQGVKAYDLSGFNPTPVNTKEEGIKRFKTKWGGTLYDYHFCQWHPMSLKAKASGWLKGLKEQIHASS